MSLEDYPDLREQMEYEIRQARIRPGCKDCDISSIKAKYARIAADADDRRSAHKSGDRRRFRA